LTGYDIEGAPFYVYLLDTDEVILVQVYGYQACNIIEPIPISMRGCWCNLTLTVDRSIIKVYINGSLLASENSSHGFSNRQITEPLTIGANLDAPNYFKGKLAYPMFWKRCLTVPEVQLLAQLNNTNLSNLLVPTRRTKQFAISEVQPSENLKRSISGIKLGLGLGL
jgi:hypothetical protein